MWINKKRRRAYWLPIVLPAAFDSKLVECDAMKWNEMEWRVFCTLDNKKLSRTTQLSVWTGEETDPAYVLFFSLLAANIWNALFDVSTRKKLTSAREMCEEMQEIEIETAPEPCRLPFPSFQLSPPFFYRWRNIGDWYKLISMKLFIILFLGSIYKYLVEFLIFSFFYFRRKTIALFLTKMHFSYLNAFFKS